MAPTTRKSAHEKRWLAFELQTIVIDQFWQPGDEEVTVWAGAKAKGELRLVCKQWRDYIDHRGDVVAIVTRSEQIHRLQARLADDPSKLKALCAQPSNPLLHLVSVGDPDGRHRQETSEVVEERTSFYSKLGQLLTLVKASLHHLVLRLCSDTWVDDSANTALRVSVTSLTCLKSFVWLDCGFSPYNLVELEPADLKEVLRQNRSLERLDLYYVRDNKDIFAPEPPPRLKRIAIDGLYGEGLSHADNAVAMVTDLNSIGWLGPELLQCCRSNNVHLLDNLVRISVPHSILGSLQSVALPSLRHMECFQDAEYDEALDWSSIKHLRLDCIEWSHLDTVSWRRGRREEVDKHEGLFLNVLAPFKVAIATNQIKAPSRFVLRCHPHCGIIPKLVPFEKWLQKRGICFTRARGYDAGWATV